VAHRLLPAVRVSKTAEREERRVTFVRGQQVEDGAGPRRRPVVERQREDLFADVMPMLDQGAILRGLDGETVHL
jgi:hypothetical protein